MIYSSLNDFYPTICFGIFHIEGKYCGERHQLRDNLIEDIGDKWTNLNVATASFESLAEAEAIAKDLNINFKHILEDRKPGATGFMKGEIGLWIGTIMALRKFLASDFDVLILFEDDIKMRHGGVSHISSYISRLPRCFDTLVLYTPSHQHFIYGRKRQVWSYIRKNYLRDNPDRITRLYQHSCLAAYAVSRRGAQRILESISKEITMPLDWHIFRKRFKSYSFKPKGPAFFDYVDLESTIQNDRA
jgi:GR25 family glycosyltransferase involved in LPS biosynthesis